MVKGVSKQVIVLNSPDKEMFEQAIFILKDSASAGGVTMADLMKQADMALREPRRKKSLRYYGPVWACGGAAATALLWLVTAVL